MFTLLRRAFGSSLSRGTLVTFGIRVGEAGLLFGLHVLLARWMRGGRLRRIRVRGQRGGLGIQFAPPSLPGAALRFVPGYLSGEPARYDPSYAGVGGSRRGRPAC